MPDPPSSCDPPRLKFVASTSSALPACAPVFRARHLIENTVRIKKLCPKPPWVYTPSFTYDVTPALTHSLRSKRLVHRLCRWSRLRLALHSSARPVRLRHRRRQLGPCVILGATFSNSILLLMLMKVRASNGLGMPSLFKLSYSCTGALPNSKRTHSPCSSQTVVRLVS